MLTVRYWSRRAQGDGVSPMGDPTRVLTHRDASERVLRSVTTWCNLNGLAFRIGICENPSIRAEQIETSLIEYRRIPDGELLHVSYIKKAWSYMHVLHRTADLGAADRLKQSFIDIGRGIGRCENNPRDMVERLGAPPYFLYLLTGKLPPRRQQAPEPEATQSPSLLDLADF